MLKLGKSFDFEIMINYVPSRAEVFKASANDSNVAKLLSRNLN